MTLRIQFSIIAIVAIVSFLFGLHLSDTESLKIKLSTTGFELEAKNRQVHELTKAYVSVVTTRKL